MKYATARGFTDVIVFNENCKHVNGLLLIHLPAGPTAHFKLSSLKLSKDIKVGPLCRPAASPRIMKHKNFEMKDVPADFSRHSLARLFGSSEIIQDFGRAV